MPIRPASYKVVNARLKRHSRELKELADRSRFYNGIRIVESFADNDEGTRAANLYMESRNCGVIAIRDNTILLADMPTRSLR